uniref:Uncharacterized protein n=1 Tax=Timema douglasi TaxID=61478 RepID=A0A7R8VSU8_TIMDO|nr:unnamed protein product [Timema douglasi]
MQSLEELKNKRASLQVAIDQQENDKSLLQREIEKMHYRLAQINESLAKKITARTEYDRTIAETEAAYTKRSQHFSAHSKFEATHQDQKIRETRSHSDNYIRYTLSYKNKTLNSEKAQGLLSLQQVPSIYHQIENAVYTNCRNTCPPKHRVIEYKHQLSHMVATNDKDIQKAAHTTYCCGGDVAQIQKQILQTT